MFLSVLQVVNPMIGDLHFFLQHRHSVSETIVIPDFPGQLLNLGVCDRLRNLQLVLHLPGAASVGDDDADQRQAAGDQRYDDAFHMFSLVDRVRNSKHVIPRSAIDQLNPNRPA